MGGIWFSWFDEILPEASPTGKLSLPKLSAVSTGKPLTRLRQTPFIVCPGVERIYMILPELPEPPRPIWPPGLGPAPKPVEKTVDAVHKQLTKFVRQWNRLTKQMQKYADRVGREFGDGLSRHVVLAFTKDGDLTLRLSAAGEPHRHYSLGDALSKVDRKKIKSVPDSVHMSPGKP